MVDNGQLVARNDYFVVMVNKNKCLMLPWLLVVNNGSTDSQLTAN